MIREVPEGTPIEKAEFVYSHHFMGMEHNYLCAVCREEFAIIQCWDGILQPCRKCQKTYRVIKLTWFDRLLGRQP